MKLLLIALTLIFISCKESSKKADSYFDSLVNAQVTILSKAQASLTKHAFIDGKEDETTFLPDSAVWENELDIFRQLAVSERPAYRDAYRIEDGVNDVKSNLTIRSYQAQRPMPVQELKFYYHDQFQRLKKIEAAYREQNTLFTTSRKLEMNFEEINGQSVLSSYGITGIQKMVMTDSVKFSIQAKVIF